MSAKLFYISQPVKSLEYLGDLLLCICKCVLALEEASMQTAPVTRDLYSVQLLKHIHTHSLTG